mgnify:CR=1 FL=1
MGTILPYQTLQPSLPRTEILKALTEYYEFGDLSFIETVNNITYGYKVEMKRNLTKHDQQSGVD